MHKRDITYQDLEGNTITETFYFHMNKAEALAFQAKFMGKRDGIVQTAVKEEDFVWIVSEISDIVLYAFGEKAPDGKSFMKSDERRAWFKSTDAYGELVAELMSEEKKGEEFVRGVMPADMVADVVQDKPAMPPPAPPAVVETTASPQL